MLLYISLSLMCLFPLSKEVNDVGIEWLTLILENLTTISAMVVYMVHKEEVWYGEIMALILKWNYKQFFIGRIV